MEVSEHTLSRVKYLATSTVRTRVNFGAAFCQAASAPYEYIGVLFGHASRTITTTSSMVAWSEKGRSSPRLFEGCRSYVLVIFVRQLTPLLHKGDWACRCECMTARIRRSVVLEMVSNTITVEAPGWPECIIP
jgi:hypothetical protein